MKNYDITVKITINYRKITRLSIYLSIKTVKRKVYGIDFNKDLYKNLTMSNG